MPRRASAPVVAFTMTAAGTPVANVTSPGRTGVVGVGNKLGKRNQVAFASGPTVLKIATRSMYAKGAEDASPTREVGSQLWTRLWG